ncbi:MAG: TraB/GumN family protein [Chitinophagales bacterium]
MKQFIFSFIAGIIFFLVCSSNTCGEKTTTSQERTSSLLWEISGNGLANPSYLYGTIHLIDKKDFIIRPFIDSVMLQTEQVAFEIKLDDMTGLMKLQALMLLPEGKTLQGMMKPEDYEKLKIYLQDSLNTSIESINNQKPMVIMQMMAEKMIKGEKESFELHFLMQCIQNQKTILGLETVEQQMGFFDLVPYNEQISWLMEEVNDPGKFDKIFEEMVGAYKTENLEAMAKLMKESSPELMKYEDVFLADRNISWIPKIEEMIKSKTTFIAVGAGHLPGENGVIELLRKKGYVVKPV